MSLNKLWSHCQSDLHSQRQPSRAFLLPSCLVHFLCFSSMRGTELRWFVHHHETCGLFQPLVPTLCASCHLIPWKELNQDELYALGLNWISSTISHPHQVLVRMWTKVTFSSLRGNEKKRSPLWTKVTFSSLWGNATMKRRKGHLLFVIKKSGRWQ